MLTFQQIGQLEEHFLRLIDSYNDEGGVLDELRGHATRILTYYKDLSRFNFEFEMSRNIYTIETGTPINSIAEANHMIKRIINSQTSHLLTRNDNVVIDFVRIERNFNPLPLYKIKLRRGKAIDRRTGRDKYLGQLLLQGQPTYNGDKEQHQKVFLLHDVPFCARVRADAVRQVARNIRALSSQAQDTSYYTRLVVLHDQKEIELLVRKRTGQTATGWQKVEETDINPNIKEEYQVAMNTPLQVYVPRAQRTAPPASPSNSQVDNNGGNGDNEDQNLPPQRGSGRPLIRASPIPRNPIRLPQGPRQVNENAQIGAVSPNPGRGGTRGRPRTRGRGM